MARLEVKIGALELKNPVLTASGTFGYGEEFSDFIDLNRLGGFIIKGTTLNHREGNPYPRMAETPSGMLNAVGLQNKGVDYFIQNIYPRIKDVDSQLIVNVSGATIDDYVAVCEKLAPLDRINAIEVNISCPNVKQGGMAFGTTCSGAAEVTKAVRNAYPKTVDFVDNLRRTIRTCRTPCSGAYGMAGGPCSQYTRNRTWRHYGRPRCHRVHTRRSTGS